MRTFISENIQKITDLDTKKLDTFVIERCESTGGIKKTEQILNCSQRREAAQIMKFLINIDCLGTYDVE